MAERELAEIRAVMLRETSADLAHYKAELVSFGITRRMARLQIESRAAYARHMREYPQEAHDLLLELRTRDGGFFREAGLFEALRNGVFGALWKNRQPGETFRAWVPCCGNGEEVYSTAIALFEMLGRSEPRGIIQIFGTDLDEQALETARAAVYPEAALAEVAGQRRPGLLGGEADPHRVRREIRDLCVFARHNLANDPPLSRMDLIVCRNQLGPFTPETQRNILKRWHYSLKQDGVLALGVSENAETAGRLFEPVPGKPGLYQRRANGRRVGFGRISSAERQARTLTVDGAPHLETKAWLSSDMPETVPARPNKSYRRAASRDGDEAGQHFQALLEEQARAIEALRVANEEIIRSNEELQVTNEELTAAREELQAVNQELSALNEEMQERNLSLARTSAELLALLRNIDAAVVTVDNNLRIQRFTPKAARLFSMASKDVGRQIGDLQPKLKIADLEDLLRESIESLTTHEREAGIGDGDVYRVSIRPFRGEDERIDGAIVTAWKSSSIHRS